MNLCLISSRFPLPNESPSLGPDNVLYNTLRGIMEADDSISIDVLTIRNDIEDPFVDQRFSNVKVHYYPALRFLPRNFGDPIIVKDFLLKYRFDLVHSHHPIALSKVLDLEIPKIITLHGIYWKEKNTVKNPLLRIGYYDYNTYMLKKILPKIDAFVAISPYVIDELKKINLHDKIKRIYQINNPIDTVYFNVQKQEQGPILFYPAILNERKNQAAAISAIKLIRNEIKDLKLVLTGGSDQNYLKKIINQINENDLNNIVDYKGKVSRREILDLYGKASIVYLLSKQETQPMSILEAMATGNPVIASNITSNSYLVKNGITGYLVDSNDTNAIAKYTIQLLSDEGKRTTMGKNAREVAENMHSSDIISKKTLQMYYDILDS